MVEFLKALNPNVATFASSVVLVILTFLLTYAANNRRMDEFSKRMDDLRDRLLAEIRATRDVLSARMDALDKRMDRIENQLEHPVIRP